MLKHLGELPKEKEKRILICGEGQDAYLVAYYLAKNKKLLSQTPNLNIYLLHKNTQAIEDVNKREEGTLSRFGFWRAFIGHKLSQKVHELTIFNYMAQRFFKYRN